MAQIGQVLRGFERCDGYSQRETTGKKNDKTSRGCLGFALLRRRSK
jgi:hypothetical protein